MAIDDLVGGKKRGQEGYGMGKPIHVRREDVLGGTPQKKDPLDHPLFKGVGPGTMQRFRNELQNVTLRDGRRLTVHSAGEGQNSPHNSLYLAGADPLKVRLHGLRTDSDKSFGDRLGESTELEASNIRSWFGDATPVPVEPGLIVTAVGKQRAHLLPSLSRFYNPDDPDAVNGILTQDVERLLINTAGIFSRLLSGDNTDDAALSEGFTPHELAALTDSTFDALTKMRGARSHNIAVNKPFEPSQLGLQGPHALVHSGQGMLYNVAAGYSHPLAKLGDVEEGTNSKAFAFQWAALDPANRASAVFVPTGRTIALSIPTTDNLGLLHRTVDSIAASAASMRAHVVAEAKRLESEKPFGERLRGLLNRWGLMS